MASSDQNFIPINPHSFIDNFLREYSGVSLMRGVDSTYPVYNINCQNTFLNEYQRKLCKTVESWNEHDTKCQLPAIFERVERKMAKKKNFFPSNYTSLDAERFKWLKYPTMWRYNKTCQLCAQPCFRTTRYAPESIAYITHEAIKHNVSWCLPPGVLTQIQISQSRQVSVCPRCSIRFKYCMLKLARSSVHCTRNFDTKPRKMTTLRELVQNKFKEVFSNTEISETSCLRTQILNLGTEATNMLVDQDVANFELENNTNSSQIRSELLLHIFSELKTLEAERKACEERVKHSLPLSELGMVNSVLYDLGFPRFSELPSEEEFREIVNRVPTYENADLSNISKLVDHVVTNLATQKIWVKASIIMSIVTNILSIITLLKDFWNFNGSTLHGIALAANISNIFLAVYAHCKIEWNHDLDELLEHMTGILLADKPVINTKCVLSKEEIEAAMRAQTRPEENAFSDEETLVKMTEGYTQIRNNFSTIKERDPFSIAVNGVAWMLCIISLVTVNVLKIDIRKCVSNLMFLKIGRELQQNLAADFRSVADWVRSIFEKPNEVQFAVIDQRMKRIHALLAMQPMDVAINHNHFMEFVDLMNTTGELIAQVPQDQGIAALKQTLARSFSELQKVSVEIYKHYYLSGIRPVPVCLHLWSTVGGLGKSHYMLYDLVPKLHRIVGSTDGTEVTLKLTNENHYFPLITTQNKIFLVDEFLSQQGNDRILGYLNGMISPTPLPVDAGFQKCQPFIGDIILAGSNIPGCSLAGDTLTLNSDAATALWGRLCQFQVINISRPVKQEASHRDFKHKADYSDLRFLPGRYVPAASNQATAQATPVYSKEVLDRLPSTDQLWVPIEIDGKWEFNKDDLFSYIEKLYLKNNVEFRERVIERQSYQSDEVTHIRQLKISKVSIPGYQYQNISSLPQTRVGNRDFDKHAFLVTEALAILNGWNQMTDTLFKTMDIQVRKRSEYFAKQYCRAYNALLTDLNVPEKFRALLLEFAALSFATKCNIYLNDEWLICYDSSWPLLCINLEDGKERVCVDTGVIPDALTENQLKWDEVQERNKQLAKELGNQNRLVVPNPISSAVPTSAVNRLISVPSVQEHEVASTNEYMNYHPGPGVRNPPTSAQLPPPMVPANTGVPVPAQRTTKLQPDLPHTPFSLGCSTGSSTSSGESSFKPPTCFTGGFGCRPATQNMLPQDDDEQELEEIAQEFADVKLETPVAMNYVSGQGPPPVKLHLRTQVCTKFAVYIYGKAGVGKSTYASSVAHVMSSITNYPVIEAKQSWWKSFNLDTANELSRRPHIIVSDDCCWNHAYVEAYDVAHPSTIFINTANEELYPVGYFKSCTYANSWITAPFEGFAISKLHPMCMEVAHEQRLQREGIPYGIIRRVGISGQIMFRGSLYALSNKTNYSIKFQGSEMFERTNDGMKPISSQGCFQEIWNRFNEHLSSNGHISFNPVQGHDEVINMLGNLYKTAEVWIKAPTLSALASMLSTSTSIMRNYVSRETSAEQFVYISPTLLQDAKLTIIRPDMFIVSLAENFNEQDLVDQGVKMYKVLSQGATDAAVRIQCDKYDIYVYRQIAYVNSNNILREVECEIRGDGVILRHDAWQAELSIDEIANIIFMPLTEKTDIPSWVRQYISEHRDQFLSLPEYRPFIYQRERQRAIVQMVEESEKSWKQKFDEFKDSPAYGICKMVFGVFGVIGVAVGLFFTVRSMVHKCPTDEEGEEVETNAQENSPSPAKLNVKRIKDASQKILLQNRIQQQNVIGMENAHHCSSSRDAQSAMIVDKIKDSVVIVKRNGSIMAYGLAIKGNTILVPAHYIPMDIRRNADKYHFTISFVSRDNLKEQREVPCQVFCVRRDFELALLQVKEKESGWQPFPDITSYFMLEEEMDQVENVTLLVHNNDHFDEHCAYAQFRNVTERREHLVTTNIYIPKYYQYVFSCTDVEVGVGFCGLPYITEQFRCQRKLTAFHVASSYNCSYSAPLTQEIIKQMMSVRANSGHEETMELGTGLWADSTAWKTLQKFTDAEREYFQMKWVTSYADELQRTVVVPTLFEMVFLSVTQRCKLPHEVTPESPIKVCGYIHSCKGSAETKIKKTLSPFTNIISEICPNPKKPSITSVGEAPSDLLVETFWPNGDSGGKSVLWAQAIKSCTEFTPDPNLENLIMRGVELRYNTWKDIYGHDQHRMLNDHEILNGIQYGPYKGHTEGIDLQASAGVWCKAKHGTVQKSGYLEYVERNGTIFRKWKNDERSIEMFSHIQEVIMFVKNGVAPLMPFKGSLKAELVDKTKARMFCAGPFDLQYVSTMFFGTFAAAVKKYHTFMECQVGCDPIATLWNKWTQMGTVEGKYICMDFSRWDKLLIAPLMKAATKVIVDIIMSNHRGHQTMTAKELRRTLEVIMQLNTFPTIIVEGVLYYTTRGNPSGSFCTTWLNSFCNSILSAAVLVQWQAERGLKIIVSTLDFNTKWIEANMGDDKAVAVCQALIDAGFNYTAFATISDKYFGTKTTPASKVGSVQETLTIEEVEFISRTPYRHQEENCWLNRLKKCSIEVLWHWIAAKQSTQKQMIENLEIILRESSLWGEDYYNKQLEIANMTLFRAEQLKYYEYVNVVRSLPTYLETLQPIIQSIKTGICVYSTPTKTVNSYLNQSQQTVIENRIDKETPNLILLEINSQEDSNIASVSSTIKTAMLPEIWFDSPFKGDLFKTALYFQVHAAYNVSKGLKTRVVIWMNDEEFKKFRINANVQAIEGYRVAVGLVRGRKTICVLSQTIQQSQVQIEEKLDHVLGNVIERYNILKLSYEDKILELSTTYDDFGVPIFFHIDLVGRSGALSLKSFVNENMYRCEMVSIDRGEKPHNGELSSDELNRLLASTTAKRQTSIMDTVNNEMTTLSENAMFNIFKNSVLLNEQKKGKKKGKKSKAMLKTENSAMENPMTKAFGSTQPTLDAQAPKARPAMLDSTLSNQQADNADMQFGNQPAINRLGEGGMFITVEEAAMQNWYSVNKNGGPVINVPTTTAIGKVLFAGKMVDLLNDPMQLLTAIHLRNVMEVELALNFVGTQTWAGNLLVAVTPMPYPAGATARQIDNWIRTWSYEQKALSSTGVQIVTLRRLINDTQTNVAWDTWDLSSSTGPCIYVVLATSFEQALANPATAFQIQLLSRFGRNTHLAGLNITNIDKMLAAITSDTPSGDSVGNWMARLGGITMDVFFRNILGYAYEHELSLILNGNSYREYDDDADSAISPVFGRQGRTAYRQTIYVTHCIQIDINWQELRAPNVGPQVGRQTLTVQTPTFSTGFYIWSNANSATKQTPGLLFGWKSITGFSSQIIDECEGYWAELNGNPGLSYGCLPDGVLPVYIDPDEGPAYWCDNANKEFKIDTDWREPNIEAWGNYIALFAQRLTSNGYVVSVSPELVYDDDKDGFYTYGIPILTTAETPELKQPLTSILFRTEKDAMVDSFYMYFARTPIQQDDRQPPFSSGFIRWDNTPTYEVINQVQQGVLLPDGYRRFEITPQPLPVTTTTGIPGAMTAENSTMLKFFRYEIPTNYYFNLRFDNVKTGRTAFYLMYNRAYDTPFINFPASVNVPQHAVWNGGELKDMRIAEANLLTETALLPSSDPSYWVSVETNGTNLKTVQANIRNVQSKHLTRQQRRARHIKKMLQEAIQQPTSSRLDTVSRALAVEQSYPTYTQARQLELGKTAREDKQDVLKVLSLVGGPEALAAKLGEEGAAQSLISKGTDAEGASAGLSANATEPSNNGRSAILDEKGYTLDDGVGHPFANGEGPITNFTSNTTARQGSISDFHRPTEAFGPRSISQICNSLSGNSDHSSFWSDAQDFIRSGSLSDSSSQNGESFEMRPLRSTYGHGQTDSSSKFAPYAVSYSRDSHQPITFLTRENGNLVSTGVEGGINAGLAQQQQGFNAENQANWLQGMLNQIAAQGQQNQKLAEQEHGYDTENMAQNQENTQSNMNLQNQFDVANIDKNQENTQSNMNLGHKNDLEDINANYENSSKLQQQQQQYQQQMYRQQLMNQGNLTAGLAGLGAMNNQSVIKSGS